MTDAGLGVTLEKHGLANVPGSLYQNSVTACDGERGALVENAPRDEHVVIPRALPSRAGCSVAFLATTADETETRSLRHFHESTTTTDAHTPEYSQAVSSRDLFNL